MPSRAQYTALPPQQASRELEDAFESDNEDDEQLPPSNHKRNAACDPSNPEARPLISGRNDDDFDHDAPSSHHTALSQAPHGAASSTSPGAYDFEREYDRPPPGSPPQLGPYAFPNDYGNSNGLMPTEQPARPSPTGRSSFIRRALGVFLPAKYSPLPTGDVDLESTGSRGVVRGGGVENDGVFANVMAKPQPTQTVTLEDGSQVNIAPEIAGGKEGLPVRFSFFLISHC
jgi:hypothetical protein